MDHIISPEGMGKNDIIKTSRNLIVVTAPGPGSGKLATCMSNMYHDQINGIKSGYAKFETFPVGTCPSSPSQLGLWGCHRRPWRCQWLTLPSPNLRRNHCQLQPWYRNLPQFSNACWTYPRNPYASINRHGCQHGGFAITDDEAIEASKQEIIRRYYQTVLDFEAEKSVKELSRNWTSHERLCITCRPEGCCRCRQKAEETGGPAQPLNCQMGNVIW